MKLATFTYNGVTSIGKVDGEQIIDLAAAVPEMPRDMVALIAAGAPALAQLASMQSGAGDAIALKEVTLKAPVQNPSKFLAIGMNYQDHVEEAARKGIKTPETQIWFNKQVSCINPPFAPIVKPAVSDMLDYEVELGVVIGKRCRHVSVENAHEVIFGYTVINDVSVRDVQWKSPTWTLGKSFDTHGPVGPWIVTADEIADPHNLDLKLWVNGELRQSNSTSKMVYNIYQQIALLSSIMTLEPGDLIATGTPMGVGAGFEPARYLKVGDRVRIEIEKVGIIEHEVAAESLPQ